MGRGVDIIGALTRVRRERPAAAIDGSSLRHVLIVKLTSIGDVVNALPVASALKRSYPSIRITWAIEQWTAALVQNHPAIDRVVVFPTMVRWPDRPRAWWSELRTAVRALRQEPYDVALDLQGLARSAAVTRLSGAPRRIARAGQREGAHLVSDAVPLPRTTTHVVDEYLCVAQALGATVDPVDFALPVSDEARLSVGRLLQDLAVPATRPLVVINPSVSQSWREWPAERWATVASALAEVGTVLMIGSAAQAPAHRAIGERASRPPIDLTGKTTLAEVVALLDRAALHLAADTGSLHIAVALGTPVVSVHGPTSPARAGPYRQPQSAVSHHGLCGRGCPAYCWRGRRCLKAVSAAEVIDRALAVAARPGLANR
jgi:lipopolysaccharide heptosyltransferase I